MHESFVENNNYDVESFNEMRCDSIRRVLSVNSSSSLYRLCNHGCKVHQPSQHSNPSELESLKPTLILVTLKSHPTSKTCFNHHNDVGQFALLFFHHAIRGLTDDKQQFLFIIILLDLKLLKIWARHFFSPSTPANHFPSLRKPHPFSFSHDINARPNGLLEINAII